MTASLRMIIKASLLLLAFGTAAYGQSTSGVVFADANRNGTRDAGERGLPNVAVSDQDTVVLTGADGSFSFPSGRGHGVVFVSMPDGYSTVSAPFYRREG